jgi:hydrogenase maturation protease
VTELAPRGGLLIAYGNPLRGDDGVGWTVAKALRDAGAPHRVLTAHQLTPELASDVADADRVVFIDAACDAEPGQVTARPVRPAHGPPRGLTLHAYDPSALLWLARQAHGHAPKEAWLVTVGAGRFDCGEALSPIVEAAVPRACVEALRCLDHGPRRPPPVSEARARPVPATRGSKSV